MISPHTPPGVKIECIALVSKSISEADLRGSIIKLGCKYTVDSIHAVPRFQSGYAVILREHMEYCYDLSLFRRVTDIEPLKEILKTTKAPDMRELEPALRAVAEMIH